MKHTDLNYLKLCCWDTATESPSQNSNLHSGLGFGHSTQMCWISSTLKGCKTKAPDLQVRLCITSPARAAETVWTWEREKCTLLLKFREHCLPGACEEPPHVWSDWPLLALLGWPLLMFLDWPLLILLHRPLLKLLHCPLLPKDILRRACPWPRTFIPVVHHLTMYPKKSQKAQQLSCFWGMWEVQVKTAEDWPVSGQRLSPGWLSAVGDSIFSLVRGKDRDRSFAICSWSQTEILPLPQMASGCTWSLVPLNRC